jgi:hypothetical protein
MEIEVSLGGTTERLTSLARLLDMTHLKVVTFSG